MLDYREKRITDYNLQTFYRDMDCIDMQFKLLHFWGRHPKATLSLYNIDDTPDSSKNELRNAATALVEKGILVAKHSGNGLTRYTISDQQNKEYIVELAKLE